MTLTKPFLFFLILLIALSSIHFQPSYGITYLVVLDRFDSIFRIPTFTIANAAITSRLTDKLFQFNITLSRRPPISAFSINLELSNVECFFQDRLDLELNVSNYDFVNATHAIKNGQVVEERPINVVQSVAVYSTIHRDNKYTTGKLFHLYRPLLIDARGLRSWGSIFISGNILTISANATFLASAVYPLIIDPVIGFDSIGGSNAYVYSWYTLMGCRFTATADGTVTDLHSYSAGTTSHFFVGCYYSDVTGVPTSRLDYGDQVAVTTTPAWRDFSSGISVSVTNGVAYWISLVTGQTGIRYYYDAGGTNQHAYGSDAAWPTPPATFPTPTYAARKMSIYSNYTAAGGLDLTFIVGSPIHVIGSVTTPLETFNSLSGLVRALSSVAMWRETVFAQSGLVHVYGTQTIGRELGFNPTGLIHAISTLTIAKEMLFTSTALMNLLSVLEQATEIVVTEVTVIRSGTVYPSSSLGIGKELAFTQTALIRLISFLRENKEFGAILSAVVLPSSSLTIAKEMLIRISQTIKPIAVLLPAFEVYMEIYETLQNILIIPYHLLTVDATLGISETFALALIAFIFAMAAIALVMLKRRSS